MSEEERGSEEQESAPFPCRPCLCFCTFDIPATVQRRVFTRITTRRTKQLKQIRDARTSKSRSTKNGESPIWPGGRTSAPGAGRAQLLYCNYIEGKQGAFTRRLQHRQTLLN